MVLDRREIKVVNCQYGGKPFFVAVATAKGQAKEIESGMIIPALSGKGKYGSKTEYDWRIIYHRKSKPNWFSEKQFTLLATNATTAVSGSTNAQNAEMIPISDKTKFTITSVPMRISISDKGVKIKKKGIRESPQ